MEEILLGIGGSATNDGGAGIIITLGGKLLDSNNQPINPTGDGLKDLAHIDTSELHSRIKEVSTRVALIVDNPLTGEKKLLIYMDLKEVAILSSLSS